LSSTKDVIASAEQVPGVQSQKASVDPSDQACDVKEADAKVHVKGDTGVELETGSIEREGCSGSTGLSNHRSGAIFSLLSVCETKLLRAEKADSTVSPAKAIDENKDNVASTSTVIKSEVYEPLLPPSVTDHFHEAMHEALMNVMAERDEAHAQLIAASVLHIHQLEQEKRKNERLQIELQVAEEIKQIQLPNVAHFFGGKFDDKPKRELEEKIEGFERILGKNQDDDINALCHQLAGEISAKTSHALEIIRLKETREIERQSESAEKQALKEELRRVKQLLAAEQRKYEGTSKEAVHWKSSYESIAGSQESDES
jgi:hypothetical protein